MAATIVGLIGWINHAAIAEQWRWWTVTRPYMVAKVRPHVLTAAQERALKPDPSTSFRECAGEPGRDDCPEMIVVGAGSFLMGSSPDNQNVFQDEGPQHPVTIARPFAVSKFELTFAEWDSCAAHGDCDPLISDAGWGRGERPVIYVTWDDAQRYVAWLSKMTGKPYRLLTEAEYEYAARAGTRPVIPGATTLATTRPTVTGAAANGTPRKQRRSVHSPPMRSASTTWWATYGNGWRTVTTPATELDFRRDGSMRPPTGRPGLAVIAIATSSVPVPGSTFPHSFGQRFVPAPPPGTAAVALVSASRARFRSLKPSSRCLLGSLHWTARSLPVTRWLF